MVIIWLLYYVCAQTVPAKILENLSSRDKTPREGNTVTLVCNATGIPMPTVTWNRHVRGKFGVKRESEFCPEHDSKTT